MNFTLFPKAFAASALLALGACATDPGGFTKQLQPVDVAGHTVYTVTASSWVKTCFGNPDQVTTMLSQFQHQKGDRYLTHIGSGVVIAEGDCNALLMAVGMVGAGAAVRPSTNSNKAVASTTTRVKVGVGGGY